MRAYRLFPMSKSSWRVVAGHFQTMFRFDCQEKSLANETEGSKNKLAELLPEMIDGELSPRLCP